MPRKNPRPAAKKIRERIEAKLQAKARFDRAARPILTNPHSNDRLILAAIAARILGK